MSGGHSFCTVSIRASQGEEAPIGLILCMGKNQQVVELMQLGQADIHVAEYLTEHLPQSLLEQRLQEAIRRAKEHLIHAEEVGQV